ncbi:MAG: ABC transporter permease [Thermoplasmatales archaeon]|nr:ABC transporter permease [Thermoplasmatales archaeon]
MNKILAIAKKEFMDNWRNKWIIALSAIFLILTLVISYFSKGEWQSLSATIVGMMSFVEFLIPILGLMLGYATIAGEKERGSLAIVLSYPVKRWEVLLGKFLGLSCVIASSIFIGFGIAGIVIGMNVKEVKWMEYFSFIALSILLGIVYVAISIMISSLFKKRATAMGGAIFTWFLFSMIWGIILFGLLIIIYKSNPLQILNDNFLAPNWFYILSALNPVSAFESLVYLNVTPLRGGVPIQINYPSFYNNTFLFSMLLMWIILSLVLAYLFFKNRDI